jgi:hypothetical protein
MSRFGSSTLVAFLLVGAGCGARTGTEDGRDAGADAAPDAEVVPPEVSCAPVEVWTTIARPAVLYGAGTDDGWVAAYEWSIVTRPDGSATEVFPAASAVTSLTPDVAGDFVAELLVTDDQGATATCRVTVHSIVGPPVAFCPDDVFGAVVGRPYTLVGDAFDDELLVGFEWAVASRPSGSRAVPTPASEPATTFTPDMAGTYVLAFDVVDNDGLQASCEVTITSSGPPRAICPPEATAPTRQPHDVAGDAEDDGEIALWYWEVVERPVGSAAGPVPPTAQRTTLTPDLVGPYVLRLTVTDDTGLSDSCEAVVVATPTPPEAVCPETITTTPFTEVTLRGDAVDDGEIVAWEWRLAVRPEGSAASPPEPADEQVSTFVPDLAGTYVVSLSVVDDDGMEGECDTTILAIPGEGLRVELYWNPPDRSCDTHPGPDCDSTDVDLHLLHPDAPTWFSERREGGGGGDCYYANCVGGVSWDAAGPLDDPRLDLDDVDGHGPENINVDEPIRGSQ